MAVLFLLAAGACRTAKPAPSDPRGTLLAEWRSGRRDTAAEEVCQWLRPGLRTPEVLTALGPPEHRADAVWVYEWTGAAVNQQPTEKGSRFTVTPVPRRLVLRFDHNILLAVEAPAE